MSSPAERSSHRFRALAVAGLMLVAQQGAGATEAASAPSAAASAAATSVERVRELVDEQLGHRAAAPRRTEHHLRWTEDDEAKPPTAAAPPPWLFGLAQWLAEGMRWAMWLLAAIVVALVAVFAWRWVRVQSEALRDRSALRPTHVNQLDIRPDSLPADIAGAARSLVQRGQAREALSLLYRGALSSLVHAHGVEVHAASTEGECLRLAQRHLPTVDAAYFGRLVQAWQIEVYADRRQAPETLLALCDGFGSHLGGSPSALHAAGATA